MEQRQELERDLGTLNVSLVFLLLIILAVLLSLWSALIQRAQLQLALEGRSPSQTPSVDSLRSIGSALTVGCLGFFLCLALGTQAQTKGDPAAERSARVNVSASLLVLLAAILRLVDLQTVRKEKQQTLLLEETTLPD